jgi:hypothetical protein
MAEEPSTYNRPAGRVGEAQLVLLKERRGHKPELSRPAATQSGQR